MRIAIVGAGIAGLGAAWLLHRRHEIVVYEAGGHAGGHANTVDVEVGGRRIAVDTGFIVYNERTYPNLVRLFATLGVPSEESDMSFAVSRDQGRFEYAGSLGGLLAQPTNLARVDYWRMLRDLLRFYREAPALLETGEEISLGAYLARGGYGRPFVQDHLLPMGAAIWSSALDDVLDFPALSFVRFCANHGLLDMAARPRWRTVSGGSREYVRRLTAPFAERTRLATPVAAVRRTPGHVIVRDGRGQEERYDQLVLATHGDQALGILGADAAPDERAVLSAFRYARNRAVLHRDARLMPRRRRVWSSWNYLGEAGADRDPRVSVTYWMNRLQNIDTAVPLFVTLNPLHEPDPETVLGAYGYDHPQFDAAAIRAQRALPKIQGIRRTWFCGSYCGYGFHEDGLEAGFAVAAALDAPAPWADVIVPASPAAAAVAPLPPAQPLAA